MDFIIDMHGLRDKDANFLPKEIAILSIQSNLIIHALVISPHGFDELSKNVRETNDYIASQLSGLHWFDGDITLRRLRYHLYNVAKHARKMYIRGAEKAAYISNIVGRSLINLEDYACESFAELERKFPSEQTCYFHTFMDVPYKRNSCALRRAYETKEWLRSLLPIEFREKFKEKSSELVYARLMDQARVKARRTLTFEADFSGDEVDVDDSGEEKDNRDEHSGDFASPESSTSSDGRSVSRRQNTACDDETDGDCV